jgi:hypothetical protein
LNTFHRSTIRTISSGTVVLLLAAAALPAVSATPAKPAPAAPAARPATSAGQGANGTLQWGQRQYYPQGCLHNGNHAICTFAFINNGELATINATPGGELWGTQFVDNGHVPHNFDNIYFVDQFNNHQNQLVVQRGDRGTLTLEFALVDPAVTYGEFHLRDQVVTGIAVNQPNYSGSPVQGGSAPQLAGAPQQPMQAQMPAVTAANIPPATQQCVPGQGSMAVCNAMNNTSGALAQAAQVGGFLKALMPQKTQTPPPQQQAVAQPVMQQPLMQQPAPAQQPMTQQQLQQMQQQLQQQEAMLKLQQQQLQLQQQQH